MLVSGYSMLDAGFRMQDHWIIGYPMFQVGFGRMVDGIELILKR
jgi:hypothetical protein